MRDRRDPRIKAGAATIALALLVGGAVVAQDPRPPADDGAPAKDAKVAPEKEKEKEKEKAKPSTRKGRLLRAPAKAPARGARQGADPLANAANADGTPVLPGQPLPEAGKFHYRFKIVVGDGEPLSAAYYPAKLGNTSPVVLLVHERERSSKDFEESIAELKKFSFAEDLQKQGYAVLAVDYRGHGASTPRRTLPKAEWPSVVNDLQTAYYCLVDRHNRGELNLAKLGVVALGEGANAAATWAAMGGGVSGEGRTSDLGALVLVSPMVDAQAQNLPIKGPINALAARVPLDLVVGERDAASAALIDDGPASVKAVVRRYQRTNKVETFPSALHGYKLLQFEPNMTSAVYRFLETSIKVKVDEWDGRYLLTPVNYAEIKILKNPVRVAPTAPATKKDAN